MWYIYLILQRIYICHFKHNVCTDLQLGIDTLVGRWWSRGTVCAARTGHVVLLAVVTGQDPQAAPSLDDVIYNAATERDMGLVHGWRAHNMWYTSIQHSHPYPHHTKSVSCVYGCKYLSTLVLCASMYIHRLSYR
jgi:hypothetical protein